MQNKLATYCKSQYILKMTRMRDNYAGKQVGNFFVEGRAITAQKGVWWSCRCQCGKLVSLEHDRVVKAHSCGCKTRNQTHGLSQSRTYKTWRMMLARCNDQDHKSYPYYGGKGVTVCERWLEFENFYADMGERPKGLTIDRIDNDGNYEPGNCRWVTMAEQHRNKRRSGCHPARAIRDPRSGKELNASALARDLGLSRQAVYMRLKMGWPMERIIGERKHGRSA